MSKDRKKQTYLITGGSGFIGWHLCRYLSLVDPKSVIINIPRKVDLSIATEVDSYLKKINKIDYIFHLADVSGNKDWSSKNSFNQTLMNVKIHSNLISSWKFYQPQAKFIFVSSVWAYPIGNDFSTEDDYWSGSILSETRHYGYSKKIATILLEAAQKDFGLKSTTLILGTVFGPGDRSDHFIPAIIRRMKDNQSRLMVYGSGEESRDFIFIDDQVKGIYLHKDVDNSLLNIGTGNLITIRMIIEIAKNIMNYPGEIIFKTNANTNNDIKRGMSVEKAKKLTGWSLKNDFTDLEDSLALTIQDMYENG